MQLTKTSHVMVTVHSVMMSYSYIIMIVGILLSASPDGVHSQSAFSRCRILYDKQTCYSYYTSLRDSLLSDPVNVYELEQAFFPMGRFTSNILLNVLYTINFTDDAFDSELCQGVSSNTTILNSTTNQLNFFMGWSSSKIFNILSPLQLSELQLQISNAIYGLFIIPGSGVALADSFAWNRTIENATGMRVDLALANLIRLELSLSNNTLCIPNRELFMSALQDITIMLKIWASTQGEKPKRIYEDDLGFITQHGYLDYTDHREDIVFKPFFAALLTLVSSILGISAIVILGALFPKGYLYLSEDRRQFKYYFFALAFSLFVLNIVIIATDFAKLKDTCKLTHYSYVTEFMEKGCSGIVITKITYFIVSAILSLAVVVLSSKDYNLLQLHYIKEKHCLKLIFMMCAWSITYFLSLVVWAILPTILMMIIYPHIVVALTVVMLASIFWLSVMLTIPQIFFHNIRVSIKCLDTLFYIMPFAGLIVLVLLIGIITVIYVNSVVFGSDVYGPIGLLLATIPSIALMFFSEFYRDWFLTTTTSSSDAADYKNKEDLEATITNKIAETNICSTTIANAAATNDTKEEREMAAEKDDVVSSNLKTLPVKKTQVPRARLVRTGESLGFLHRKLNDYINPRSRVQSTSPSLFLERQTSIFSLNN